MVKRNTLIAWFIIVAIVVVTVLWLANIANASEVNSDELESTIPELVIKPVITDALQPISDDGTSEELATSAEPQDPTVAMIKSSRIPTRDIEDYLAAGITDKDMEGSIMTSFPEIDRVITEDIENGFPSAQICVMKRGEIIYEGAWGYLQRYNIYGAPLSDPVPVTTETLYDIGGSSVPFTAQFAALHLISEGKLHFDDKVADIIGDDFVTKTMDVGTGDITEINQWKFKMTVEDLLRNQSGFPAGPSYYKATYDYGTGELPNPLYNHTGTREETLSLICATPLDYEPGTSYRISDIDGMLLAFIVEEITGESLDTYLTKLWQSVGANRAVFNPLENGYTKEDCAATELSGNTRFGFVDFPGIRTDTVQGEVHDEAAYYLMDGVSGNAGLFANARSLARIVSAYLYPSEIFSGGILKEVFTPTAGQSTGIGWWLEMNDDGFLKEFWINGFTHCFVSVIPVTDTVIVYLTNSISSPLKFMSDDFAEHDLAHAIFAGNTYRASRQGFIYGY